MKEKRSIAIDYNFYSSVQELEEKDRTLLDAAVKVSKNAYAPYSAFKVGAALQLENEGIILGSNQENAAYPSGLCAERVALFAASANHPGVTMEVIAIYTDSITTLSKQISPCGSCRQVMSEYEVKQSEKVRVLLMNAGMQVWEFSSCADLLPLAFDFNALKKD